MTSMATTERADLCDLALQVGEDQPTLCGEWTVKDLIAHLVLREGSPRAIGAAVPALSGWTDRGMQRLLGGDFAVLVERLRNGPPRFSPFALPKADALLNVVEFFVHHEDIRRAQPSWTSRPLQAGHEDMLWKLLRFGGRGLVRKAPVGVVIERRDTGKRVVLKRGEAPVVVRGLPGEVTLFVYGRKPQAEVELLGSARDVASLRDATLGF
jgi:uncharacterized protein (TIGR03085 family)